jgi:hypothetical protein
MPTLPLPVQALLHQENLQSLLWVTTCSMSEIPHTCLTPDAVLDAGYFQRFDLVFIDAGVFTLDKSTLLQLFAKARDLLSSRVMVEWVADRYPQWQEADFLGLAMRRRAVTAEADGEHVFYGYDLKTYKPAPDWLNPKYWANPHMWDKARW